MAVEKGYDISLIKGTGGNGHITRRDVATQPSLVVDKVGEPLTQAMTSVNTVRTPKACVRLLPNVLMSSLHLFCHN